ncbi:MAG: hypothetical protein WBF82_19870, partial [Mycobacterium sp.]
MTPTQWGSGDDPERTEVVRRQPPPAGDPDKTVVIASSHGAPDETTTPVTPTNPPAPPAPSGYAVGAYGHQLGHYPVASPPIHPARRGRGALWAVLAIWAVALSAGGVLLVLRVGPIKSLTADKLNIATAQAGVRNVLADSATGYGLAGVKDVVCNHGVDPTIVKHAMFT